MRTYYKLNIHHSTYSFTRQVSKNTISLCFLLTGGLPSDRALHYIPSPVLNALHPHLSKLTYSLVIYFHMLTFTFHLFPGAVQSIFQRKFVARDYGGFGLGVSYNRCDGMEFWLFRVMICYCRGRAVIHWSVSPEPGPDKRERLHQN